MKVHYSEINKLWYINCPRCKVTHAFGLGHRFDGNMAFPTVQGSLGWTGENSDGVVTYCHSIVTAGKIKFDDGVEITLTEF